MSDIPVSSVICVSNVITTDCNVCETVAPLKSRASSSGRLVPGRVVVTIFVKEG